MKSILKISLVITIVFSACSCFAQNILDNLEKKALLIGVNMENELIGLPMLPGIEHDLERMKALLKAQGYQVRTMMNPEKKHLLAEFEAVAVMTGVSEFFFYYSGHSSDNNETGYLVPVLSEKASNATKQAAENGKNPYEVKLLTDELISSLEIHNLLKLSLATKQLVVIDGNTRQICKPEIFAENIQSLHFYCAGPDAVARLDGGVFTSLILQGLKGGADKQKDGQVDTLELETWLKEQIPEMLGEKSTLMQNPTFFHFGENQVLSNYRMATE